MRHVELNEEIGNEYHADQQLEMHVAAIGEKFHSPERIDREICDQTGREQKHQPIEHGIYPLGMSGNKRIHIYRTPEGRREFLKANPGTLQFHR